MDQDTDQDLERTIRERAYEIWEREGRSGDPGDHWLRAEREVGGAAPGTEGRAGATEEDRIIEKLGDFA